MRCAPQQPRWRQTGGSHPQRAALGGLAPPLSRWTWETGLGMWRFCELCLDVPSESASSDLVFPAFLIFQRPVDHPPQVSP